MIYYIYKIVCGDLPDFIYVGSTRAFKERKYRHKQNCNNEKTKEHNFKLYQTIRTNGGWDNWRMVVVAETQAETKRQAEIVEEEWRLKLQANLNCQRCFRTEEQRKEYNGEWRENNKEWIKQRDKEYRENNKEQIKEYQKDYRENNKEKINKKCNCECGGQYTNSKKHKEYLSRSIQ